MLRIISGSISGRRLKTLAGTHTRPTSDKVKGAIFNVLAEKVSESRVLDLFAGSGALALEALSRGAYTAILLEKSSQACEVIRENIHLTGFDSQVKIFNRDGLSYLKGLSEECFDLVFIDPPYNQGLALNSLHLLATGNYLSDNAVIIVETSREEELPVEINGISLRKKAKYGDTLVWYYQPTDTEGKEN
jgi:16S rRNA (guanine966-N2)-methyltransferase